MVGGGGWWWWLVLVVLDWVLVWGMVWVMVYGSGCCYWLLGVAIGANVAVVGMATMGNSTWPTCHVELPIVAMPICESGAGWWVLHFLDSFWSKSSI